MAGVMEAWKLIAKMRHCSIRFPRLREGEGNISTLEYYRTTAAQPRFSLHQLGNFEVATVGGAEE